MPIKRNDPDVSSDEEKENSLEIDEDMENSEQNEEMREDAENSQNNEITRNVYIPGQDIDKDTPLECDESAYIFYHKITAGEPCLSFDIVPDKLGSDRADNFPLTMTLVAGTQAEKKTSNSLIVMNLSNINKSKVSREHNSDDESESESDDEDEDAKPILEHVTTPHQGCVNRIKATEINDKTIVASWSELGKVYVWNVNHMLEAVNDHHVMTSYIQNNEGPRPLFSFAGHQIEGYAMEWSPLLPGVLATGDCKKNIHLWKPLEGGTWHVDQRPFIGHTASVEDIQWSPNESNVMASCSVDKTIRIWDIRAAPSKACMLTQDDAHDLDVNVISWNKHEPFILSGGDDGKIRIWDLRTFPNNPPLCTFKHHTAPITSVEWHPTDSSVFAASGADDQLTLWDLSVERDKEQEGEEEISPEILALPQQLLFIHQGQNEIKELHWHKQMPGVLLSTAQSGFNVFRTLSV